MPSLLMMKPSRSDLNWPLRVYSTLTSPPPLAAEDGSCTWK
jgi:hypothetical protein